MLDDEVALRFFRLQQMTEGSIDLAQGETYPLKGPTDVGTGGVRDEDVALSSLIDRLNERFGTDFAEADQLFFDQMRASAEHDETIAEAARARKDLPLGSRNEPRTGAACFLIHHPTEAAMAMSPSQ